MAKFNNYGYLDDIRLIDLKIKIIFCIIVLFLYIFPKNSLAYL